jgi:hypothetical protein
LEVKILNEEIKQIKRDKELTYSVKDNGKAMSNKIRIKRMNKGGRTIIKGGGCWSTPVEKYNGS